ncbi:pyruvate/2-oxoglutarate dehydrogenase complex dihydrolipoamide dehydrogenase (E3) component [Mucilaginibacter frigoritolerans]|uniref:Pyruvate/2-oxoglutarate dehydrogenase complex dihydrolipoamide dehydrogenase (E3) component n=1 Tax=Mucilaginibacter frigoritolerans TaxID=652788 RepID=A0A562U0S7_9SPHI|nr:mercuric reductase [Mucilaginibacter frigoritolerans]TWI99481.1 pyruvate/2-oxoglutarate dehydrogenase complex dihydrolipoamide dehydrogenase (E3) component [Mucilaginibacter frigoritolerans]
MKQYDAIVIGSGQAGGPLAKKLALSGKKTALIEKRWVGGTCVNDGCTPTKTMVASAKMAYLAANSVPLGVKIKNFSVDLEQIRKRKDEVVHQFRNGSQKGIESTKNLDLIFGDATFIDNKTILVKLNSGREKEFKAELFFINTGAKTFIPDIEGLNDIDYLTSTTILDLEEVPEHLLILGGNYIGLEFGQMFRRFGSNVTILEKSDRIVSREDEDISEELTKIFKAEDISIYTKTTATSFKKKRSGKISVLISADGKEEKIKCTHVLIAVGRMPQTETLNLQKTGVEVDEHGAIRTNNKLETSAPGIYALGDVKGGPAFTHISYNDYTVVYRNLIENADLSIKDRQVPYCMFTDPQLGRVGLSETEAKKRGINYKVAKLPMAYVARAIETGDTRGFMKAIVDADTKQILGAAILGVEGGETMTILQMAMSGGITYEEIRYYIFAHPLFAESLNNLFMALEG